MRHGQPLYSVVATVAAIDVAAIIVALSGLLGAAASGLIADLTSVLAATAGAVLFTWTGLLRTREERQWRWLMALGLACFALVQSAYTWYHATDSTAFPNTVNALYLGLPIFAFAALLSITKKAHRKREEQEFLSPRSVVALDGIIIVGSLLALVWKITFDLVISAERVPSGRLLIVVSYTVAHLALLVVAILFAIALPSLLRAPLALIAGGIFAIGCSHAIYLYAYSISNSVMAPRFADIGYVVGLILLLAAAVAPERRFTRLTPRFPMLFLPYFPLAVVCGFTLFTTISTGIAYVGEIYALMAVVVLVVLRQVLTLRQLFAARRQLSYQATHDSLTDSANRDLLLSQLGMALSRDRRLTQLGLLYADLDHFKEVNDFLGHEAGDTVLRITAARLATCIRHTDTLARVGGDEFVILLNPAPEDPQKFCERILLAFKEPVWINNYRVPISASIGYVAVSDDDSPEQALARADAAMYQAKAAGREQIQIDTQIQEAYRHH